MKRIHLDPSLPTLDPTDLIGRTFLLPHRAKVTRNVVEIIDQEMVTEQKTLTLS